MTASTLHVRPRTDGRWAVELEDGHVLSVHHDATLASAAAAARAQEADPGDVVVHDRYACVHVISRADRLGRPAPRSGTGR